MTGPIYTATERFGPWDGAWDRYIEGSGLTQLTEVVSLDGALCPSVVKKPEPADWDYIVKEDFMLDFFLFVDLNYLLKRIGSVENRNLLCVFRNPDDEPSPPRQSHHFHWEGCDLVEARTSISALTNCLGGFPLAFSNDELSSHGLLPSLQRARQVQEALRATYRGDPAA